MRSGRPLAIHGADLLLSTSPENRDARYSDEHQPMLTLARVIAAAVIAFILMMLSSPDIGVMANYEVDFDPRDLVKNFALYFGLMLVMVHVVLTPKRWNAMRGVDEPDTPSL